MASLCVGSEGPRAPDVSCVMILGGHTFTVMLLMVKKLFEASRHFTAFLPRCCDYSWSQIPHETIDALLDGRMDVNV